MTNEEQLRKDFYKEFEKAVIAYEYGYTEEMTDELANIMEFSANYWLTHHRQAFERVEGGIEGLKGKLKFDLKFNTMAVGQKGNAGRMSRQLRDFGMGQGLDDALAIIREEI